MKLVPLSDQINARDATMDKNSLISHDATTGAHQRYYFEVHSAISKAVKKESPTFSVEDLTET